MYLSLCRHDAAHRMIGRLPHHRLCVCALVSKSCYSMMTMLHHYHWVMPQVEYCVCNKAHIVHKSYLSMCIIACTVMLLASSACPCVCRTIRLQGKLLKQQQRKLHKEQLWQLLRKQQHRPLKQRQSVQLRACSTSRQYLVPTLCRHPCPVMPDTITATITNELILNKG